MSTISKGQKIAAVSAMVARWRCDRERLIRLFGHADPEGPPTDEHEAIRQLEDAIITGDGWLEANKVGHS